MEKIMIRSEELADPLFDGTPWVFRFYIAVEGDRIRGTCNVVGRDDMEITQEEMVLSSEIEEAQAMRFWLSSAMENLVRERSEQWTTKT